MNHRTWICTVLCLFLSGCGDSGGGKKDASVDAAGNMDAGKGMDSGADGDTDTDSDNDIDTDTDMDTDTDTDSDSDSDSGLPKGCKLLSPANENAGGWTGKYAMDDDHLVWRWLEHGTPTQDVLMVRKLSTGEEKEILRVSYPEEIVTPSIYGNNVVFSRQTDQSDALSREIFLINLEDTQATQVTDNVSSDADPMSGLDFCVYTSGNANAEFNLNYSNLNAKMENEIPWDFNGGFNWSFDGVRWVAFTDDGYLYSFDIENSSQDPQLVYNSEIGVGFMSFDHDTHELVTSLVKKHETDGSDIWLWNIETGKYEVIVTAPYSQTLCDIDSHVIAYVDSQANGTDWRAGGDRAEVRIVDRDTNVIRKVMPLDVYYGIGIWSHYLAMNNYGRWGDSIILCDLLEGGFMDADGHVIPEGGAPDAGVPDSGVPDAGVADSGVADAGSGDSGL